MYDGFIAQVVNRFLNHVPTTIAMINFTFICIKNQAAADARLIPIRRATPRRQNVDDIFHDTENTTKIIDHNLLITSCIETALFIVEFKKERLHSRFKQF